MTTADNNKQVQDRQLAEKRFQVGIDAYANGKLEPASEAFNDAEIRFRLIGDFKRAGDARSLIADVQQQQNQLEAAINSYQRAARFYRDADRPLQEAQTLLALGHIERQLAHLDRAQDAYKQAEQLYRKLNAPQ